MKRKELKALKIKLDQLEVFEAYRAIAECQFARNLAITNGYVFGPEQYRQWLLYRMYMCDVTVVVCNRRMYCCQRIIEALEKQAAHAKRHLYYARKRQIHVVRFLKLADEERQVYLDKMFPMMITYRGSDFAEAFLREVHVWNNIFNTKVELVDKGFTLDEINRAPANLLARVCVFGLEDFRARYGEREYRKAVKQTYKFLSIK